MKGWPEATAQKNWTITSPLSVRRWMRFSMRSRTWLRFWRCAPLVLPFLKSQGHFLKRSSISEGGSNDRGRQSEDGLDTLPARAAEANRSTLIADIPFPAPENVAAKRCASEKRAF